MTFPMYIVTGGGHIGLYMLLNVITPFAINLEENDSSRNCYRSRQCEYHYPRVEVSKKDCRGIIIILSVERTQILSHILVDVVHTLLQCCSIFGAKMQCWGNLGGSIEWWFHSASFHRQLLTILHKWNIAGDTSSRKSIGSLCSCLCQRWQQHQTLYSFK